MSPRSERHLAGLSDTTDRNLRREGTTSGPNNPALDAARDLRTNPEAQSTNSTALQQKRLNQLADQIFSDMTQERPTNRSDTQSDQIETHERPTGRNDKQSDQIKIKIKEPRRDGNDKLQFQDESGRPLTDSQLIQIGSTLKRKDLRQQLRQVNNAINQNLPWMLRYSPLTESHNLIRSYSELRRSAFSRVRKGVFRKRLERLFMSEKEYNKAKGEAKQLIDALKDFSQQLGNFRSKHAVDASEQELVWISEANKIRSGESVREAKKYMKGTAINAEDNVKRITQENISVEGINPERLKAMYDEAIALCKTYGNAAKSATSTTNESEMFDRTEQAEIHASWIEEFNRRIGYEIGKRIDSKLKNK